jgi:hypothetical protein
MHLVCLSCWCSSGRKFRLFARVSLGAVDRGCAGWRSLPATHSGDGAAWAGGGREERLGVRVRGGAAAFYVEGGGATELAAALSQQREARESQTAAVDGGSGSSRSSYGSGRRGWCRVGSRGEELIRLLEVVGGLVVVVAGGGWSGSGVVLGAGGGRLAINKDGGGRGRGGDGHSQRNERSSQGHGR